MVEAHKAAVVDALRQPLLRAVPWAGGVLECLRRDSLVLTHIREHNDHVWFLRVASPPHLQQGFGLAPEVLIVLVRNKIQANDVRAAAAEVVGSGLRLDGNLMIVANGTTDAARQLETIGGHGHRIAWMPHDGAWPTLEGLLRTELPGFDAYEERDPVRGAQLVGREAEVAELRTRVVRGDAVGLFGLRKVGKTSVLRAVTDWFDPASGTSYQVDVAATSDQIAVVLDASVVIERTVDALSDEMLRVLDRRMRAAGRPVASRRGKGIAAWKAAIEDLLDAGHRFCFAIDEYDLLFEAEDTKVAIPLLNKFFRLIRGWAQMHQGKVSLVLVGRDASFLSAPEVDGVTNALLMWCTPMWIGPLSQTKAGELLRKLGKRVGLEVGQESGKLAFEWTGGHPLLHRQFGSALRVVVRRTSSAWNAPTDASAQVAIEQYCAREAVLEVFREVVALLRKRHPAALDLLRVLAQESSSAGANAASAAPDAAGVLSRFGLVASGTGPSETFRWYLGRLPAIKVAQAS